MTEKSTSVYFGSAVAEKSHVTDGVRVVFDKWLERIGPKSSENEFTEAHQKVLSGLTDEQKKEIFIKEFDVWKRAGKYWGIAATVIDISLAGVGFGLAYKGFRDPWGAVNNTLQFPGKFMDAATFKKMYAWISTVTEPHIGVRFPTLGNAVRMGLHEAANETIEDSILRSNKSVALNVSVGRGLSTIPLLGSLAILAKGGPGHWLVQLAANIKEKQAIKLSVI